MNDAVVPILREQLAEAVIGSLFLFVGLATFCIAAIRGERGARILVWLGLWSAMYGAAHLSGLPAVLAASPGWLRASAPYARTGMTYLLVVAGLLSFRELSRGGMRFESDDCGKLLSDDLPDQECDIDSTVSNGLRDAVGEACLVVALQQQGWNAGGHEPRTRGGRGQLLVGNGEYLNGRSSFGARVTVAHDDVEVSAGLGRRSDDTSPSSSRNGLKSG